MPTYIRTYIHVRRKACTQMHTFWAPAVQMTAGAPHSRFRSPVVVFAKRCAKLRPSIVRWLIAPRPPRVCRSKGGHSGRRGGIGPCCSDMLRKRGRGPQERAPPKKAKGRARPRGNRRRRAAPTPREGAGAAAIAGWKNLRGLYELDVAGARLTRRVRLAPPDQG